ncbi:hypothetical protein Acid7E03_00700 [Acidisoma sp. 7E03]
MGLRQQHQPEREDQIGTGQHVPAAVPVNAAAGERTQQTRQQKRSRKRSEKPDTTEMQTGRYGIRENCREIIGRCPGEGLRDAER